MVAIAGPPNAGKSSLLNRLARREAAIVSPYAGTTRDVIEVHLDLGGYPVTLLDTAGVRESDDPVEQEGVRRARARAAAADLVLWVVEAAGAGACAGQVMNQKNQWIVQNKVDLLNPARTQPARIMDNGYAISALTGAGVDRLVADAWPTSRADCFRRRRTGPGHPRASSRCAAGNRGCAGPGAGGRPAGQEELIAEELRLAARALGRLTGRVDVEDVLDVIFRDFCIGK